MNEVPFYQTRAGRQFYESTLPELVRQITRVNDLLARAVDCLESQDREPESCKGKRRGSS